MQLADAVAVIALARERGVACRELLVPRIEYVLDGLVDRPIDAATLLAFEELYLRASRDKARVAAGFGIRLPASFVDDPHAPTCAGCMRLLFDVILVATLPTAEVRL